MMSITQVNKDNLSIKELEPLTEDIIQSDNEEDQTEQQNAECIKVNNFITEVAPSQNEETDHEYYKTISKRNNQLSTNRASIDSENKENFVRITSERKIISAIPKKENKISTFSQSKGTLNNENVIRSKKSMCSQKSKSTRGGDIITRPSTAYVGVSRQTSRRDRRLTSAKESAFSSQGKLVVKKKRPKTGIRPSASIPILPKWAKSIDEAKESKSFKNFKALGACI